MSRYLMVIENAGSNYSADLPDLPGCVTTGTTADEIKENMEEAIELHLEGCAKMAFQFLCPLRSPSTSRFHSRGADELSVSPAR